MLFNRDLSWLGFNYRVLQEAADDQVPLLERIKFLSIFSSNLDEFFRVRYPSIFALSKLSEKTQRKASTVFDEDLVEKVQSEINRQLDNFGYILTQEIIPALKRNKIYFYYKEDIKEEHKDEVKELFLSKVLSFIQPIYLEGDVANAFIPKNNQLYLVVTLKQPDGLSLKQAIINIPSDKLPRFFSLSSVKGVEHVIFIDDIVRDNMSCIFPGNVIEGVYSIKFNRDAELKLDEEYSDEMLFKVEKQLKKRDLGSPSRFLYEQSMPRNVQLYLATALNLKFEEMFAGGRYHNLSDLSKFPSFDKKDIQYEKFKPLSLTAISNCGDVFQVLNTKDILLHLPYQSYNTVLSFFNQAAVDINVTEIYITLYRVASESHIVNALISAARNGKKVVVFVELKARFDEANNIRWSRMMREAGVKIVYGIPRVKVHSKIAIVKRKVDNAQLSYAILSTGNFNEVTAQFYTDHVLMTSDPTITNELQLLFKFLQKEPDADRNKLKFEKLIVSKFNMVERFERLIEQEIQRAQVGEEGVIRVKINNLEDPDMINLLYKASQAGVKVQLLIRGICCLVPGVQGMSENIEVRRIVDRYLEHSRLFIFGLGDNPEVILGSSDWMIRNLHHRIEVCVAIKNMDCKRELMDYFNIQWSDTAKAVNLSPTLEQYRVPMEGEEINAQMTIYKYLQHKS